MAEKEIITLTAIHRNGKSRTIRLAFDFVSDKRQKRKNVISNKRYKRQTSNYYVCRLWLFYRIIGFVSCDVCCLIGFVTLWRLSFTGFVAVSITVLRGIWPLHKRKDFQELPRAAGAARSHLNSAMSVSSKALMNTHIFHN